MDVKHEISTAARTIGARELPAGSARVLTISRTYPEPVADVWDAVTNPERIPRWFLPISGDLTVGGRYQFEGNAGGVVESCDPPHRFTATWEYGEEVSWVEVRLSPDADGTRFELEHVAHVDDERWLEFGPGAVGVGWDLGLIGLGQHLATGEPVDPTTAFAWQASGEGREYIRLSSEAWVQASVEAGADPAQAQAAGERTTAAYTPPAE